MIGCTSGSTVVTESTDTSRQAMGIGMGGRAQESADALELMDADALEFVDHQRKERGPKPP